MKNLHDIKNLITLNGGATLDGNGRQVIINHGYMVSLENCETITTLEALSEKDLKTYFKLAKKKHAYFGLWLDGNALYLDISIRVEDKAAARKIGKHNKQKAIFDLATKNTIYLN